MLSLCLGVVFMTYAGLVFNLRQLSRDSAALIEFNNEKFQQYVLASKRNYSVIILLTTAEEKCKTCRFLERTLENIVAYYKTNIKSEEENVFFFISASHEQNSLAFQKLDVQSLPKLVAFLPSNKNPSGKLDYPINADSIIEENIIKWINEITHSQIQSPKPLITPQMILYIIIALGVIIIIKGIPQMWANRRNPWLMLSLCLGVVFMTYAGLVFNLIHNPPPLAVHPHTNQIMFVYPSLRHQFILEGLLAAILISAAGISFVMLTEYVLKQKEPQNMRYSFYATLLGFGLSVFYIVRLFNVKNPGYPFFLFQVFREHFTD